MRRLVVGSTGIVRVIVALLLGAVVIAAVLVLGSIFGLAPWASTSGSDVLTETLSEPLNGVAKAKVDINAGDGNLTVNWLRGGEQVLAAGTLQYSEKQGPPTRTVVTFNGEATLNLRAGVAVARWPRLPWAACNGATEWQIQLNPTVSSDIEAHSDGGNIKLILDGMVLTRVSADTGGGNIDVVLPDSAADLSVTAKTGGGTVVVGIPDGVAARIHATTGLGKVIVDPRFSRIDETTYESPDFDGAANRVEVTADSGAGNVVIESR